MNNNWDEVLDTLSTHQKVADKARYLIENGDFALACMLLRDTLRTDGKFQYTPEFVALCGIDSLLDYLFKPKFAADLKKKSELLKTAKRLMEKAN